MNGLEKLFQSSKRFISTVALASMVAITPSKSHAITEEIFNEIFTVPMYDTDQKKVYDASLEIIVNLDVETNRITMKYLTEDYNRTKWTPQELRIPLHFRYTPLKPPTIWVLYPDGVELGKSEQTAYIVPQNRTIRLKSSKDSQKTFPLFEFGVKKLEEGLDWIGTDLANIPLGRIMNNFVVYERENRINNANTAAKNVNQNYHATEIEPNFADENYGFGFTETARDIQFSLDMADLTGDIPISILTKVQLGDPSDITGVLQTSINFTLRDARGDPLAALGKYFLQEDELKMAKPTKASDCVPNAETNPYFLKKTQLDEVKRAGLNLKNSGIACYFLQPFNDDPKTPILEKPLVIVSVSEFKDEKDLEDKAKSGIGFASIDGKVVYVINNNCLGYDNLLRPVKRCNDDQIRSLNKIISLNLIRVQPKYIVTNSGKISVDEFLRQLQ